MISVELAESRDYELINDILTDSELFPRISEDGINADDWTVPTDKHNHYFLCLTDDGIAGLFIVHPLNFTTIEVHINILKSFRKQYAFDCGAAFVNWFAFCAKPNFRKCNCQIPLIYEDVMRFTEKFGFKKEGLNRCSVRKKGQLFDQMYYGLTRREAVDWVSVINDNEDK